MIRSLHYKKFHFYPILVRLQKKGEIKMDSISSNTMSVPQIYAMKKAMEIEEQGLMKILGSAIQPDIASGSSLTGLGQTLDLRA